MPKTITGGGGTTRPNKSGRVFPHAKSLEEFFWMRVQKCDGCWEWQGTITNYGYGNIPRVENGKLKGYRAHRVSWELHHNKKIPEGLCICHHCDNRKCVRPDHLFLGTRKDNWLDAWYKGRAHLPDISKQIAKTECPQGHLLDEKNTYYHKWRSGRHCRTCRRLSNRRHHWRLVARDGRRIRNRKPKSEAVNV